METPVHIFGIRHHGPGSSCSLINALSQLNPDIVLIEGPPDADSVLGFAASPEMVPPVALLVYMPEQPTKAVFYPFAAFSPEWAAIQFGENHAVPVRFMDLPQSFQLAQPDEQPESILEDHPARRDPLGFLASLAGYSDSERWWESIVEHRRHDLDVFGAILEAMTALRDDVGEDPSINERRREAYMRQTIRKAAKEGYSRIAVVCGAWHSPALTNLTGASTDLALLSGLPKVKVSATWVPWTNGRLSYRSGYGAGIESPGWYSHLWTSTSNLTESWMVQVSRLLREQDLGGSPAQVIDSVRLAETLASLRSLTLPGLSEMNEAVQTVFTFGSNLPLRMIEDKLIVGNCLGAVPSVTSVVPLQSDLERTQRKLRLNPDPDQRILDLDLRKDTDLSRSHLLHRMALLGIDWGKLEVAREAKGTFHELWRLQWHPEFAISIIESSIWGNTVVDASESRLRRKAADATDLPTLCELVNMALLAELPNCIQYVLDELTRRSVYTNDLAELMDSLPPLANVARYGNVRRLDSTAVLSVVDSLVTRICIGLPNACATLDDDASAAMFKLLRSVQTAISLLQEDKYLTEWFDAIGLLSLSQSIHGLIAGRCCRILLDAKKITSEDATVKIKLALNLSVSANSSADWLEGFLKDSGQLLQLDDNLRCAVDNWVCALSDDTFIAVMPLLRRTFSEFTSPERKQLGQRIKAGHGAKTRMPIGKYSVFDQERAAAVLPLLFQLIGVSNMEGIEEI